jgi:hypothetical protein
MFFIIKPYNFIIKSTKSLLALPMQYSQNYSLIFRGVGSGWGGEVVGGGGQNVFAPPTF